MKKSVNGSNIVIFGRFLKLLCWLAALTMRTGPAADEIQAQSPQPGYHEKTSADFSAKTITKSAERFFSDGDSVEPRP